MEGQLNKGRGQGGAALGRRLEDKVQVLQKSTEYVCRRPDRPTAGGKSQLC